MEVRDIDATVEESCVFPLSFPQQRLWFLDQLVPGNPFYNLPAAVPFKVLLDAAALRRSIAEIVCRHEILRTTFAVIDGEPVQVVAPRLEILLPVRDLRGKPPAERQAEALRLAGVEARRPFDLSRGPLLRTQLVRLGERDYLFLLTLHHIIADGWSMGLFWQELVALYEACCLGRRSPLPELPIQYGDFAVWQREQMLAGDLLDGELAYWGRQLAHLRGLRLPSDHPRPAVLTFHGAHRQVALPVALSNALQDLARRQGATLFMAALAAFQALLQRYTGEVDIAVGSPVANRLRPELERLIGFFVNTLVLRADLTGDPSFLELLARVRRMVVEAFAHQTLPFEKLVEHLQPERDLSHNPLFQVTFQLFTSPEHRSAQAGLPLLEVQRGSALFDLACNLAPGPEGLRGQIEYNTDLFDRATIARLAHHFEALLGTAVENPARRLSDLPLLDGGERQQLLREWNDTWCERPLELCVHALFEAQAARRPEAVAVVDAGGVLTYRELERRANQLGWYLRRLGVRPDDRVGILVERSPDMVVALFGVLKAGGAYLPLDPASPGERLEAMLADSRVEVLLTHGRWLAALPPHSATVICLDVEAGAIARESCAPLPGGAAPDNLAYVIFTSGSTGRPKGVMISHRALCNHMLWMAAAYPLSDDDVVLQRTPLSFDASVWEIFAPLASGASLALPPPGARADAGQLAAAITRHGVSILQLVPALLGLLLDEGGLRDGTLRRVFCGGEALPAPLADRLLAVLDVELHNLYGPTEACIQTLTCACSAGEGSTTMPIGRPVDNVGLFVLDASMQPVPLGAVGELFLGGASLGRGYLAAPALTAERFVPDPWSGEAGARLYRTGDLVRYRATGCLEFVGRSDHQLKLRGFRIEPGEIEALLQRHPAVRTSAVLLREDRPGDQRLVAYVVADGEPAAGAGELRGYLEGKLPPAMVPAAFVTMSALPLMPNGKVDRAALAAEDPGAPPPEGEMVAPRSELERVLVELWAEALGVQQIGVRTHFFRAGGHSLLATRLISRLRDLLRVDIPLQHLFEAPTVELFAGILLANPAQRLRVEKTARLLLAVGDLSEEEVEALVSDRSPDGEEVRA